MTYFKDCKTIEDVKEAYRKYAKALHPDNGGDAEVFKRMQQAYTAAYNRYKGVHRKKAAGNTENTKKAAEDTHNDSTDDFSAEAFASIIDKIIGLDGIDIEIVGSWIWLSGNTYPYKDIIKAAGFFWSTKHKKWYYSGDKRKAKNIQNTLMMKYVRFTARTISKHHGDLNSHDQPAWRTYGRPDTGRGILKNIRRYLLCVIQTDKLKTALKNCRDYKRKLTRCRLRLTQ